jgi:hypothetical protein
MSVSHDVAVPRAKRSDATPSVRAGHHAEARQEPPVSLAASAFDPAVLPYRQWRVYWVQHEASPLHMLFMGLAVVSLEQCIA